MEWNAIPDSQSDMIESMKGNQQWQYNQEFLHIIPLASSTFQEYTTTIAEDLIHAIHLSRTRISGNKMDGLTS